MAETLKLVMTLSKLRIGFAIMLCALAGIAVAPAPGPGVGATVVLALAVLLSSGCAGAFNHYVERDLDARMVRTRRRPFASGRLAPGWHWPALFAALLAVAVAGAAMATNGVAALHVFLGAFTYGVVYTLWLKRRTVWNIVLGGLAGSFAVLAGASAVDPVPGPAGLALALVLFFWTPPHFWSLAFVYRDEYARAGVPMLPVVAGERTAARIVLAHTLLLVACSLVPVFYGMGWLYLAGAFTGGAWFVHTSVRFARSPSRETARLNFRASLGQLTLLLLGAMLDGAASAMS
jgi:protoheme IX farnesyltransferase